MRTDALRRSAPSHMPHSRRLPRPRALWQEPPHLATPARLAAHRFGPPRSWRRTPLERRVDEHSVPPVAASRYAPASPHRGLSLLALLVLGGLVLVAARGVVVVTEMIGASVSGWSVVAGEPPPLAGNTSEPGSSVPEPLPPSPVATEPGTSVGTVLVQLDGNGIARSPVFETDGSWAIEWRHPDPGLFSLRVVPAAHEVFGAEVETWVGPTAGRQPMYDAAAYYLQVMASDRWSVTVEDTAPVEPVALPVQLAGSGPSNSPLFVATGPWLLEWTVEPAQAFGVESYESGEDGPILVVDDTSDRASCAEFEARGEFYLHVVTHGAWTLTLSELSGETVCPTR